MKVDKKDAYHHGDLRSQLIEAVRDLVESHGPDGFSVTEASRRAGVSSAAPYKHFRDKPDILRAVALDAMGRFADQMEAALAADPTADDDGRIIAIGKAYVAFARAEPGVFRLVFGLSQEAEPDAEVAMAGARCFGIVVREAARRLGVAPDNPAALRKAYMLWVCVHGHAFLQIDGKARMLDLPIDEDTFMADVARRAFLPDQAR